MSLKNWFPPDGQWAALEARQRPITHIGVRGRAKARSTLYSQLYAKGNKRKNRKREPRRPNQVHFMSAAVLFSL